MLNIFGLVAAEAAYSSCENGWMNCFCILKKI